jgi:hypothetical protein
VGPRPLRRFLSLTNAYKTIAAKLCYIHITYTETYTVPVCKLHRKYFSKKMGSKEILLKLKVKKRLCKGPLWFKQVTHYYKFSSVIGEERSQLAISTWQCLTLLCCYHILLSLPATVKHCNFVFCIQTFIMLSSCQLLIYTDSSCYNCHQSFTLNQGF